MSDMLVLRYAVHIDMRNGLRKQPLRVYCPQEPVAQRELLDYKGALEVVPVSAGERLSLGDIDVEFCPAVHPIPCLSMKFSTGKSTLVYSGDTEPNSDLESLARDADTLLCEATCTSTYSAPGHFLCEELGRFAKRARVGRLIATHFATGEDVAQAMREIRLHYPDAEEAQERRVYKISRKPDS
jgi:ribonuclease BN (tRNA processing enzyme)